MRNQVEIVQNPEKSVRHHLKIRDKSARHNPKICKISLKIRENPRAIIRKAVKYHKISVKIREISQGIQEYLTVFSNIPRISIICNESQ